DPYGLFAFLDFQLVDTGFFQQFDQFLNFTDINESSTPKGRSGALGRLFKLFQGGLQGQSVTAGAKAADHT
ncbi:hypothetical protein AAE028_36470, partial [Sinorhizobium sp. CB9]